MMETVLTKPLRVLIVEDSEDDVTLIIRELTREGYEPVYERVETAEEMARALKDKQWDIIISDYVMPKFSGLEALKTLNRSGQDLPFIVVSGRIGEEVAVEAMKAGAHDYLLKFNFMRLSSIVEREMREAAMRREHRRADQILQESEARFRQIVETANEGILQLDTEGKITFFNQRLLEMMGYSAKEIAGRRAVDFIDPENHELARDKIAGARQGEKEQFDFKLVGKDNCIFWVLASTAPLTDPAGGYSGLLIMITDITERKKSESLNKARFNLLDKLRHARTAEECLMLGCTAIVEAGLFTRAAVALQHPSGVIREMGHCGMSNGEIKNLRNARLPDETLIQSITQPQFRIGQSFLLPVEVGSKLAGTFLYVPHNHEMNHCIGEWREGHALLVPIKFNEGITEGWLSVNNPPNCRQPAENVVAALEEVANMVIIRVKEIQKAEELAKEQQALKEKNITLREVLAAIESEKMDIRKQISSMVEDVLVPAVNRMLRRNGTVNMTYYNLVKSNLRELAVNAGGVLPISTRLSPRELEICSMIKNGASSKDIAEALDIALVTVQKHREVIRKKLGLTNRNVNLTTHLRNL